MGDPKLDRDWGTHKTGMLVNKGFPQGPVARLNLTLATQTSYLPK